MKVDMLGNGVWQWAWAYSTDHWIRTPGTVCVGLALDGYCTSTRRLVSRLGIHQAAVLGLGPYYPSMQEAMNADLFGTHR